MKKKLVKLLKYYDVGILHTEKLANEILSLIRAEMPGEYHVMTELIGKDVLSNRESSRQGFNNYRQTFLKILGE